MSRTTTKLVTLFNIARGLRNTRKLGSQRKNMSQFAALEAADYEEPEREQEQHKATVSTYLDEGGLLHSNNERNDEIEMMHQGIQMKQNWIPHPRSGIYFPEGHDWVMNDVSETAASLGQSHSFWLRNNIHGAEKHDPDLHNADDYFLTSNPDYYMFD